MRKKVDSRVRTLVENGVKTKMRSMIVLVGDRGRDQVVNLHYMLHKILVKKPTVLWCYKKELGFSSHRKKRMRQVKRAIKQGQHDPDVEDPFDVFLSSTNIRYCYYKDTEQVLGKTFTMCILSDFEALTPNLMCRTMETVEGGGMVILLLKTMDSLKDLYSLTMDAHRHFRTETHVDFEPRFNERLILSLGSCPACLALDDELNVLPLSKHVKTLQPVGKADDEEIVMEAVETALDRELEDLKEKVADMQPLGPLTGVAKTLDQAKAVMSFIDVISEKTLNRTVALTAARGRGKSAALGLAIASAIAYGYSNIFVTAPSPENLGTVFEFIIEGFKALGLQEHQDYELVQAENTELNKALVRVNVFRDHRQTVQYIAPSDWQHCAQAELLVIDEAAAIPLPVVKRLLGPYLVLISSTVNGYEGTGRALSLKLFEDLRQNKAPSGQAANPALTDRTLRELTLEEPIRYAPGDHVESWLGRLLCLEAAQVPHMPLEAPPSPSECRLFVVNRDALFSHHEASEKFLFKVMSLFVSSHYKNSPNDLLLMADAPSHQILVLLPPLAKGAEADELPEVFVAMQICLEGALSSDIVHAALKKGKVPSGDMIPYTLAQHFLHDGFARLSGARVVKVATHPKLQRKGYGSEALRQLTTWLESGARNNLTARSGPGSELSAPKRKRKAKQRTTPLGGDHDQAPEADEAQSSSLREEELVPREAQALLEDVSERPPNYRLDYIGTSFGLTLELFDFWRKDGFQPVYLRQVAHDATGEYSCILLKSLQPAKGRSLAAPVIEHFVADFRLRFLRLLRGPFREQPTRLALAIACPPEASATESTELGGTGKPTAGSGELQDEVYESQLPLTAASLLQFLSHDDLHRMDQYGKNMVEYGMVLDVVPAVASLYLAGRLPGVRLSALQAAILVAVGCQGRTFDQVAKEFSVPASQLLALFNKAIHKVSNHAKALLSGEAATAAAEGGGDAGQEAGGDEGSKRKKKKRRT